jgi:hypothetical protein
MPIVTTSLDRSENVWANVDNIVLVMNSTSSLLQNPRLPLPLGVFRPFVFQKHTGGKQGQVAQDGVGRSLTLFGDISLPW